MHHYIFESIILYNCLSVFPDGFSPKRSEMKEKDPETDLKRTTRIQLKAKMEKREFDRHLLVFFFFLVNFESGFSFCL